MGTDQIRAGDKFPPYVTQMRKNVKTTLEIEKSVHPHLARIQDFHSRGVGLTKGYPEILIPANDAKHSYLVWKHCKDITVEKVQK